MSSITIVSHTKPGRFGGSAVSAALGRIASHAPTGRRSHPASFTAAPHLTRFPTLVRPIYYALTRDLYFLRTFAHSNLSYNTYAGPCTVVFSTLRVSTDVFEGVGRDSES
ncbi:hypothetical protein EVAR_39152_1 [Eumeta japonica]|uniref:Uncharacterized protein n=1 Tax=Eumeta variegata TaxID=151549 RepID=A0A4C1X5M4_EUMVA|nr:hypothetical protein EVAR_39152_1 [Eumeta japonica]